MRLPRFSLLLVCLLLIANHPVKSQTKIIDSLKQRLSLGKEDTNQVNTLIELSWHEGLSGNYAEALLLAKKAITLSEKFKFKNGSAYAYNQEGNLHYLEGNYGEALENLNISVRISTETGNKKSLAYAYMNIGNVYRDQGNYSEALKTCQTILKIFEEQKDKKSIANVYNNIGIIQQDLGNNPEALKNYLLSMDIREKAHDKPALGASYNNIGNVYESMKEFPEALKYHQKSLQIRTENADKFGIAMSLNNLGIVYNDMGLFQKALESHLASLEMHKQLGDKRNLGGSYNNVGLTYSLMKNYPEALNYYSISKDIRQEIGDREGTAESFANLGDIYILLHRLREAKTDLDSAELIYKRINRKPGLEQTYGEFVELDSATRNYTEAFRHFRKFLTYHDSLFNEENSRKIVKSEMNFEFDKKLAVAKVEQDKKDALSKEEKQKQRIVLLSVLIGLLFMCVISVVIFRSLRVTKKQKHIIELQKDEVSRQKLIVDKTNDSLNQQNEEISAQRDEIETQKYLLEEKNKEIIDSIYYAQRIQHALLPSEYYIKKQLKDYFILFLPKDIVSGDFYWILGKAGYVYVATADCTGHGVPGAFMSMMGINLLNEIIIERDVTDPALVLGHMREEIIKNLNPEGAVEEAKDGMDMVLCKFDFTSLKLEFAGANNSIYLERNGTLIEYKGDKMPVGKYNETLNPFTKHTVELQKNDTVYSFTDGYADQFGGEKGKKFKYKRLEELLLSNTTQPLHVQKQILSETFESWKGNLEQVDDVLLIGVKI